MPTMPPTFRRFERDRREEDRRRGSAQSRGYNAAWAAASASNLVKHPLCDYCELQGLPITPATLTDHLYPHRKFAGVFWRREWWVSSCDSCHSSFKQALEHRGKPALDDLARRLGRPVLTGEGGVETSVVRRR